MTTTITNEKKNYNKSWKVFKEFVKDEIIIVKFGIKTCTKIYDLMCSYQIGWVEINELK